MGAARCVRGDEEAVDLVLEALAARARAGG